MHFVKVFYQSKLQIEMFKQQEVNFKLKIVMPETNNLCLLACNLLSLKAKTLSYPRENRN